ncbi:MAG: hydroxylamine reductase, partial [Candidatus Omnitrophica bacterium]|nr:hydroxylamine reductase [Candidatus Omnitrophota bacterium]
MFCFQCQETVRNTGCTMRGVCGKPDTAANLMDILIYTLKGLAVWAKERQPFAPISQDDGHFICQGLFVTITNANFDEARIIAYIKEALARRESIKSDFLQKYKAKNGQPFAKTLPDCAFWTAETDSAFYEKAKSIGVLATANEDVRSLREFLVIGLKGVGAYTHHAAILGFDDQSIYDFAVEALASTTRDLPMDAMLGFLMQAGEHAVKAMALLDKANTTTYGNPQITKVNIGTRNNPGILISGHDLKDMEELLEQTQDTGVDVYTHSEMLPANYYPKFKKYPHFVGNYGGSWWHQDKDFTTFNGVILMTTNCIIPVKDAYKNRIFTTGNAGYPGVKHIPNRPQGGKKNFSVIIALAKTCPPPQELEKGEIVGGFAHAQVLALADKVVAAVKSGAIKRFVVMAGCDGRQPSRSYFADVAQALPQDMVILTAGCAKYRYNKLNLGDIGGIPRVLDAGQCNDSYSLAVVALKLKEVFGLSDV